jgi:hypothetical protein
MYGENFQGEKIISGSLFPIFHWSFPIVQITSLKRESLYVFRVSWYFLSFIYQYRWLKIFFVCFWGFRGAPNQGDRKSAMVGLNIRT